MMSSLTPEPAATTATTNNNNKLQAVNYANAIAYVANVGVTYGVGLSGLFPTNAELSEKYQTLVTPAGYAFSIWGLVFLSQLVWVVLQLLLPSFRNNDLVRKGVGYWYVATCVAQCAWSIAFSQEWILASFVAMVSILVSLVMILIKSSSSVKAASEQQTESSVASFWGFQFPFQIHCGWIWAASLVNANVVLVAEDFSASYLFMSALASLGAVAMVALFYTWRQTYVIPLVLAWASTGIYVELMQPQESITTAFDETILQYFQYAALGLAIAIVVAQVMAALMQWRSDRSSTGTTGARNPSITALELTGRNKNNKSNNTVSDNNISTNYVHM